MYNNMYCYWHINHLTCLQVGLVEQQELHQMRNRIYSTPTDQLWDDQWFLVSRCSSELEYDAYTFPDGRLLLNVLKPLLRIAWLSLHVCSDL